MFARRDFFTSGATESNNWVIKGVAKAYRLKQKAKPHIITSAIEHHCILAACASIEKEGLAEVTYLSPDSEGIIFPEAVKKAIKNNTALVSIMYVNNEIGVKEPIEKLEKSWQERFLFILMLLRLSIISTAM